MNRLPAEKEVLRVPLDFITSTKYSEKVSCGSCAVSWQQKYRNNSSISLQAVTEIRMSTLFS